MMRTRYIILIVALLAFAIAAFIIIATAPKAGDTTTSTTPTPLVNADETLHGENVSGRLYFERGGSIWRWQNGEGKRITALKAGTSPIIGFTPTLIQPAVSPDGTKLAYVRRDESYSDIYVASVDGSGAKALTNNTGQSKVRSPEFMSSSLWALSPVWKPDGTQFAYLSDNGTDDPALWVMGSGGGGARKISGFGQGFGGIQRPAWSSKGVIAATVFQNNKDVIYQVNPGTGALTQLISAGDGVYDPAWSPDGTHIAYVQRRAGSSFTDIWVANADGTGAVQVSQNVSARSPVWSPNGAQVAFLGLKDKDGFFDIYVVDYPKGASSQKQVSQNAKLSGAGGLTWGS